MKPRLKPGDFQELAVYIIMGVHFVDSLKQFMQVNKRTYNDQAAQHTPKPIVCCAEAVCNAASLQFCADTIRDLMVPHDACDTQSDGSNNKQQQAKMHGFLAVISGSDNVNVV